MSKSEKGSAMVRLQSAARLSRTALAGRLLEHGFYAGQDQIMLSLSADDGQTPGQLALKLGVRPPTITKTINRLQAQGILDKRASEEDARQAHIFLTERGKDAIKDFRVVDDIIKLDNALFTKVGGNGSFKSSAFYANTSGKAHDANDRVIYDKDSGALYYDADGTGAKAGVCFATINKNLKMTAADFFVS